jgi:hypothetical protein
VVETKLGQCFVSVTSRSKQPGKKDLAYTVTNSGAISCMGIRAGIFFKFKTHIQAHLAYFEIQFRMRELLQHPAFPKNIVEPGSVFYPTQPLRFYLSDVVLKTPTWLKRQSLLTLRHIQAHDALVFYFEHPKIRGHFEVCLQGCQATVQYSEPLKALHADVFCLWEDEFLNTRFAA